MAPYTLPPSPVWFITGCSTGIGHALALHLHTHHPSTRIVATARNPSTLHTLPSSPNILKLPLDVTSATSIASAITTTLKTFGRIDVLVNNAGFNTFMPAELLPEEQARLLMETNFWGPVRLTRAVLPSMRGDAEGGKGKGKGGVVVQVSSMGGRLAFAGNAVYHASKFALEGWTEALSKEVEESWNIHFVCIEPGGVKTKYASTALSTAHDKATSETENAASAAYAANPNSQLNVLRAMHDNPDALATWADVEDVVGAVYGIVEGGVGEGGEIPLRVPLGADSWGMQRLGVVGELERLDGQRDVALGVSRDAEGMIRRLQAVLE